MPLAQGVQTVDPLIPAVEYPALHGVQVLAFILLIEPGSHAIQATSPIPTTPSPICSGWYFPAGQNIIKYVVPGISYLPKAFREGELDG